MRIIVGLGNPGKEYKNTRHNVGFMVLDKIAQNNDIQFRTNKKLQSDICKLKTENGELMLVKPQTFMNDSGVAVKKIVKFNNLTDEQLNNLYVIHDDLDIPLGSYKIQFAKGPKDHKGIKSIEDHLKSKNFWRLRIGIAGEDYQRIKLAGKSMAEEYVLKLFRKKEQKAIEAVIEKGVKELFQHLGVN